MGDFLSALGWGLVLVLGVALFGAALIVFTAKVLPGLLY